MDGEEHPAPRGGAGCDPETAFTALVWRFVPRPGQELTDEDWVTLVIKCDITKSLRMEGGALFHLREQGNTVVLDSERPPALAQGDQAGALPPPPPLGHLGQPAGGTRTMNVSRATRDLRILEEERRRLAAAGEPARIKHGWKQRKETTGDLLIRLYGFSLPGNARPATTDVRIEPPPRSTTRCRTAGSPSAGASTNSTWSAPRAGTGFGGSGWGTVACLTSNSRRAS